MSVLRFPGRTALAACGLALTVASCAHAVVVRPAPSYEAFAFGRSPSPSGSR